MPPRLTIPTPQGIITVRPDGETDGVFLRGLFSAVRASEMADLGLDAALQDTLTRLQFTSMRATYAQQFPHARSEIVELDAVPVGRIVTDVSTERVLFVDIAILPALQRRRLATALMLVLLEEPRRLGLPAQAQVLVTNTASLRLCARVGFVRQVGVLPHVLLEWRG